MGSSESGWGEGWLQQRGCSEVPRHWACFRSTASWVARGGVRERVALSVVPAQWTQNLCFPGAQRVQNTPSEAGVVAAPASGTPTVSTPSLHPENCVHPHSPRWSSAITPKFQIAGCGRRERGTGESAALQGHFLEAAMDTSAHIPLSRTQSRSSATSWEAGRYGLSSEHPMDPGRGSYLTLPAARSSSRLSAQSQWPHSGKASLDLAGVPRTPLSHRPVRPEVRGLIRHSTPRAPSTFRKRSLRCNCFQILKCLPVGGASSRTRSSV